MLLYILQIKGSRKTDIDYLSIHIAFYLASWGMYRGLSFLLQKDYKIHIPVVKVILKPKYNSLCGIRCVGFREESNQILLAELNGFMASYYDEIRREVKEQDLKNKRSDTLLTKILMGTLGCMPAYDRYLSMGLRKVKSQQDKKYKIFDDAG